MAKASSTEMAAGKPDKPQFFDYINGLSAAEWENRKLYIYRTDVQVQDALEQATGFKYTDVLQGPFSDDEPFGENYLHQHYGGGGELRLTLNNPEIPGKNHIERQFRIHIDGAPKWSAREHRAGLGRKDEEEAVAEANANVKIIDRLLDRQAELERRILEMAVQKPAKEDTTIEKSIEAMMKANEKSIDFITNAAQKSAEKMTNSMTGSPLVDRIVEQVLGRLNAPAEKPPTLAEQIETAMKLRELAGGGTATGLAGIRQTLEELKSLGVNIGIGEASNPGGGKLDVGAVALQALVPLLQNAPTLFAQWMQKREQDLLLRQREAQMMQESQRNRGNAETLPATALGVMEMANLNPLPPAPAGPDVEAAKRRIVQLYRLGFDGDAVVTLLKEDMPLELLELARQANEPDFFDRMRVDPIVAPVLFENSFLVFAQQLAAALSGDVSGEADGRETEEPLPTSPVV